MRAPAVVISLLLTLGCGEHKEPKRVSSPEELQLAQMASDLATKSEALLQKAPSGFSSTLSEFDDKAHRFSNASQRFGPGSLEARSAFDRMRYQAVQLDIVITSEAYPDLLQPWKDIRKDMDTIGSRLGYKIRPQ